MNTDCVFCKIITGDIPSYKIAEDEHFIAILDIAPAALGHALVIPKAHCVGLLDMPDAVARACLPFAQKAARAIMDVTGADGFNIVQNNGETAGQVVMHYHTHIIPRRKADGLRAHLSPMAQAPLREEMAELAQKLADKVADKAR